MMHAGKTAAPGPLAGAVDELFAPWDHPDTPGGAAVVIKDGAIAYMGGFGCANLEYDIPIRPSTPFHIASVSKQFTAFVIALLVHDGQLSLDDDVRVYVPEVPDFGRPITVRHLVHHTSGLRCKWELMELAGWRRDDVFTREQVIKMVRHQRELNFEPGAEHLYSNIGYILLAEIVERVTGRPLRDYARANLFEPLGMASTHYHDDHEMLVKNMAYSYSPSPCDGYRKCVLSTAYVGSSSLYTTAQDLARWLLNADDKRVGGKVVYDLVHQRGMLNDGTEIGYAFGLYIREYEGFRMVYHSGGTAGYRSYLVRFPEHRLGVAVLSNLSTVVPERLALQVARLYLGLEPAPIEPRIAVDPALCSAYAGYYLLPDGRLTIVSQEDGHLVSRSLGLPKLTLSPVSETTFVVEEVEGVRASFQQDQQGRVTRVIIQMGDQIVPARRIEPPALSQAQLDDYTGDYTSDELGTTYTMVALDGRLVAQHRRNEDTPLVATVPDQFAGFERGLGAVRFVRDAGGRVIGFRASGERVRNLRFDRSRA
jgi:CubicO group peptidase (beta-lactamase class C family)